MMQTEEFRDWWYHDPDGYAVPDGPSVVTEMDGSGWPELVLHGTFAVIDREKGFVQMHLKDTDKFGKLKIKNKKLAHTWELLVKPWIFCMEKSMVTKML